ncbi:hypothetical protein SSCG_05787 [Streptomyces clavuligerus]|nr:hypothetical protein SSCG_05787 [Streptomyces clavuligerus]
MSGAVREETVHPAADLVRRETADRQLGPVAHHVVRLFDLLGAQWYDDLRSRSSVASGWTRSVSAWSSFVYRGIVVLNPCL